MAKLKILIAEDDSFIQQLFRVSFSNQELYEIREAENGEETLKAYKSWHPDIILLDIMMPVMNGYETLETIRKTLNDTKTTVIMVSAVSEKNEIIACAKLGISGYVVKPFNTKTLAATVVGYHQKAKGEG